MFPVAHTLQYLENTILDKNVKKNTPRMFHFRILHSKDPYTQDTSPSPQINNVEGPPEHFLSRLLLIKNLKQSEYCLYKCSIDKCRKLTKHLLTNKDIKKPVFFFDGLIM